MISTHIKPMATQSQTMLAQSHNPYKAKHTWPPDFSKLSPKHQFRLERRYKRRTQLKWARPRWMIATKLMQWSAGLSVAIYGILFMDWDRGNEGAFRGIRNWYASTINTFWNVKNVYPPPTPSERQDNSSS